MPIKDKSKYPENWDEIALERKEAEGWCCELCLAFHGQPHWMTGSKVVLTVHHIDHDTTNNDPANLLVACQRCHLRLDRPHHLKESKKTRDAAKEKKRLEELEKQPEIWESDNGMERETETGG